MKPAPGESRLLRQLLLALMTLACVLRMPWSAVHLDLAHDLFVAWRMLHEGDIPWSGRVLAGTIHLGPVYYWLLALLLALGRGWFGAVMLLGALAGTQIGLAYLTGKELHSRAAGMFWALGLLVPSWSTFEWLFPGHNLLTTSLVLAFLLCAARFVRRPRRRYLVGMALCFVLGLHAHPTTLALAWIGLAVVAWSWRSASLRLSDLALAAAIACLPLVPYVIWDATQGFADLHAGADYLAGGEKTGNAGMMWPILVATAVSGTFYWFSTILQWPLPLGYGATLLVSLGGVAGIFGLLRAARDPNRRRLVLAGAGSVLAIVLTTALIRSVTPYYMTTVLRTALAGMVAIGLASLGAQRLARITRTSIIAIVTAAYVVCTAAGIGRQNAGDWPFGFVPLFAVSEALAPTQPFLMLPAYASGASGAFLCASPRLTLHGVFAQQLLHDYAMDERLACARSDVKLGGADAGREHWLGLSRAMFEQLQVTPLHWFGPLGVVKAVPIAFGSARDPQASPVYPAFAPQLGAAAEQTLRLTLAPGEHVLVANVAFGGVPFPQVSVTLDEMPVAPIAADAVTEVYACAPPCRGGAIELRISSAAAADVDIVTF